MMRHGFRAPIAILCKTDPLRRALQFSAISDAEQYHQSLLRNGSDGLICYDESGDGACVCEVRSALDEEMLSWLTNDDHPAETKK